jgi:hypothetical protein
MKSTSILGVIKVLSVTSLALMMVGCATSPAPIAREAASRIHRVAVISSTAKVFTRQYTGLTGFGNEMEEIDISDWKIDEQYEEQLATELGKLPGLTVVKAPYSPTEFSHVNDLNGPWDAPAFWGPNWGVIEAATRNYCSANTLDAILVVAKTKTRDFLGGSSQFFGGAGIYVRGPGSRVSAMHLISKIALLDCTTAKPLAVRAVAMNQYDLPGAIVRSSPLLSLPEEISRSPISQWSGEQKRRIQADLAALPIRAWAMTLRSMLPSGTNEL